MICKVKKVNQPVALGNNWENPPWNDTTPLEINNFMGEKPSHLPRTQARLLYDDNFIYVFFRVEDRYVRALAEHYHGNVWEDSCVEFFFTPSVDISQGYFNLEINAGGTPLFHYQQKPRLNPLAIADEDCNRVEIYHSLPKIIDPEITEPTTWQLRYHLPIDIIAKYCPIVQPAPGVLWKANLYKCADKTSHPHWLTWAVVDNPTPDFHRPEFFGTLEFE